MEFLLSEIVDILPLKFKKGDSNIIKRLMLKNDNEFLRFRGKDQFDKKIKKIYPDLLIDELYLDYLFAIKKTSSIIRFCQLYKEHGEDTFIKFKYYESFDDEGMLIGKEYEALDGIVRSIKDCLWNQFLPPNFPQDSCSYDICYQKEIIKSPNFYPNVTFEFNIQKLLNKITPVKHKKSSYEDNYNALLSWNINLNDILFQCLKDEFPSINEDIIREKIEKFK
ncbi:MAG: hypothetical protein AB9922_07310 [Bacteroidales bacterium]